MSRLDYQQLVETIRSLLASPSRGADSGRLVDCAAQYSAACEEVNRRLRKCGDLLRQGLRSEALQLCEAPPQLLELFAVLDFPEIAEWIALVEAHGLERPPALLVDLAGDLNEAYAAEEPLAAAMRKHRLLALARAPLRDRLENLRRLARIDPGNPVWDQDIRTFERARHQELRNEASEAYKAGNTETLLHAVQEVQAKGWLEPVPQDIAQKITHTHTLLAERKSRAELEQLEPQLNAAFAEMDVEAAREIRSRWAACVAMAGVEQDDPVYQRALPALEWLDEEDRRSAGEEAYQRAIASLVKAIEEGAPRDDLEQRAQAVLRFERDLPSDVESLYQNRMAELDRARARKRRVILASTSAFLLGVVGMIGWLWHSSNRNNQIAGHVATVRKLIDQELLAEAKDHLEKLGQSAPAIAAATELQGLQGELAQLLQADSDRKAAFAQALQKVETAGTEKADRTALAEAAKHAKSAEEKAAVAQWEEKVATVEKAQQKQRDDQFLAELDTLKKQVNTSIQQARSGEQEAAKTLTALAKQLDRLPEKYGPISPNVVAQLKPLREQVQSQLADIRRNESMKVALDRVTSAIPDPEAFLQQLEVIAKDFPKEAHAAAYQLALAEREVWDDVLAWNDQVLGRWNELDLVHCDARKAQELASAWEALLAEHPRHPAAKALADKVLHVKAIAARNGDDGSRIDARFRSLLANDPALRLTGLWLVTVTKNGETLHYYTDIQPREPNGLMSVTFKYFRDIGEKERPDLTVSSESVVVRRAPQSVFAEDTFSRLTRLSDENWEQSFAEIMGTLARSENDERLKAFDPILKTILLRQVLEIACLGSYSLNLRFRPHLEALSDESIDTSVRFFDPQDVQAINARIVAQRVLESLPDWSQAWLEAKGDLDRFRAAPDGPSTWVGWLYQEGNKWHCPLKSGATGNGDLYVIQVPKGDASTPAKWTKVGTLSGTSVKLLDPNSGFVEGRPVFLRPKSA